LVLETLLRGERYAQEFGIARPTNAVLMYHSVGEPGLYGNVSVKRFRRDMAFLDDAFEIVDLPTVLGGSSSNSSGSPNESDRSFSRSRRIAVTFDDGYESFYTRALPIVRDLDIPVTVFVSPGFLDDRNREFAYRFVRSPALPGDHNDPSGRRYPSSGTLRVMTDAQLREVIDDDRVTIGNHTCLHPDLSTITNRNDLDKEVRGAEAILEERFGITVDRFAYPYGRYDWNALNLVRRSHDLAVTTRPGLIHPGTDRHRLPRIGAHRSESRVRWQLSDLRRNAIERGKRALKR
jgi:peptidoglycan/xylan/chitin deacetylase (PgdA/CDA1 family)